MAIGDAIKRLRGAVSEGDTPDVPAEKKMKLRGQLMGVLKKRGVGSPLKMKRTL